MKRSCRYLLICTTQLQYAKVLGSGRAAVLVGIEPLKSHVATATVIRYTTESH